MSNDYYPSLDNLIPGSLAKSSDINERSLATESAFDMLPKPNSEKKGFGEPVVMSDPLDDDHGVTKGWLNAEMDTPVNVAKGARDEAQASAVESAQSASQSEQSAIESQQSAVSAAEVLDNINVLLQIEKGEKGDVGDKGNKGDKGDQGDVGAVFTLSGTVLTITTTI